MILLMLIPGLNIWGFVFAIIINIILLTGWYYMIVSRRIGYKMQRPKIFNGILVLAVVYVLGQYLREVYQFEHQLLQIVVVAGILFAVHSLLTFFVRLIPK
jgi:hypothetical protein